MHSKKSRSVRYGAAMDILLTHQTALSFWRNNLALAEDALGARNRSQLAVPSRAPKVDAEELAHHLNLDGSVHILVSSASARTSKSGYAAHARSEALPPTCSCAICSIGGFRVSTVSPEMCLMQLAPQGDFVYALALSYEICGRYRRFSRLAQGATAFDMPPLASARSIGKCAGRLGLTSPSRQVRWVLRNTIDGSMSPQETALAVLLSMPSSMGGYGLPAPVLNPSLSTGSRNPALPHGKRLKCDICWPDQRVSIEYDSNLWHSGAERMTHDAIRYNSLKSMDLDAFMVTWDQLRTVEGTDRIAAAVARALGVRMRIRTADFRSKQSALRKILYL